MTTYATWLYSLLPPPLAGLWGRRWATAIGSFGDDDVEDAKNAVKARFPADAPFDALPYLGADRQLPRLPGEGESSFRARLAAVWDLWPWAGTRQGLTTAIDQLGFAGYTLRTTREWGAGGGPDRRPDLWATWWLLLFSHPWTRTTWGSGTWGSGTWGTNASTADVARVKAQLRQWSNARDRGVIRLFFGGAVGAWGLGRWGAGKWGPSGASWIDWTVE